MDFFFRDFYNPLKFDYKKGIENRVNQFIQDRRRTPEITYQQEAAVQTPPQYTGQISTTKGQIYLLAVFEDSYQKLDIQFVPDTLDYNRTAQVEEYTPLMRNLPVYNYSGGNASITLTLDFYTEKADKTDVISRVRQLQSWMYADGYETKPPLIKLVWGSLFRNEIFVLKEARSAFSLFHQDNDFLPQQAYVDITLLLAGFDDTLTNPTWQVVR